MKVTITYEFDPNYPDNPYWAKADYCGRSWQKCGKSFKQAKERILEHIIQLPLEPPIVPEPEEVEVTMEAVHANQS